MTVLQQPTSEPHRANGSNDKSFMTSIFNAAAAVTGSVAALVTSSPMFIVKVADALLLNGAISSVTSFYSDSLIETAKDLFGASQALSGPSPQFAG